jgi:hypothetical protein
MIKKNNMPSKIIATEKLISEWGYISGRNYEDPFNEVELDVVLENSEGKLYRIPAYWVGESEWRVRFSPPDTGAYKVTTICSDDSNIDLHQKECILVASRYTGKSPLLINGPLQVADSKRTIKYSNGIPFFWFADTWWMGLTKRLSWPEDFQCLTADRVSKGFTVIMIVAGLYPDMPGFDPRGMNEVGFPWERDYQRINPAYFDMADLRIQWLVRSGLVPCVVGSWGYYLPVLGIQKMKQFWRYLIARWAAYPVIWCIAGEAAMPYYLSKDKDGDKIKQLVGYTELGKYIKETDPYKRLITVHPTEIGRDQILDDSILDINLLQTGHSGYSSVSNTVSKVTSEYNRIPSIPVIVGEVNYEGIIHGTQADIQRLTFWTSFLSGCAGHTYGANGIWQINTKEKPYGPSPHGGNWGNTPWEEAYKSQGSVHLSLAKKLIERYEWWKFIPSQEWVTPCGSPDAVGLPFAAGIPGVIRMIYFYDPIFPWVENKPHVVGFEPEVKYTAFFWNPTNGEEYSLGLVIPDLDNQWEIPAPPIFHDWILVLEKEQTL